MRKDHHSHHRGAGSHVLPLPIPVVKTLEGYVFDVGEEEGAKESDGGMRGEESTGFLSFGTMSIAKHRNLAAMWVNHAGSDVKMRISPVGRLGRIVTYENDFEGNYSNLPGSDVMGWRNLGGSIPRA